MDFAIAGEIRRVQVAHDEQRFGQHRSPHRAWLKRRSNASPSSANPRTVIPSATPGKKAIAHCPLIMFVAPWLIIRPHSGVGTRTPAPIKLKPAVSSIAQPTL